MWQTVAGYEKVDFIRAAARLMRAPGEFRVAMQKATINWPFSCEHNLTATSVNRLAWLGHAGCYVQTGSPEMCTRAGWHRLTQSQQDEANRVAGEVLHDWEIQHHSRNG